MWSRLAFGWKLALLFTVPVVGLMIIVMLILSTVMRGSLEELKRAEMEKIGRVVQTVIDERRAVASGYVKGLQGDTNFLNNVVIASAGDSAGLQGALKAVAVASGAEHITVTDATGKALASTGVAGAVDTRAARGRTDGREAVSEMEVVPNGFAVMATAGVFEEAKLSGWIMLRLPLGAETARRITEVTGARVALLSGGKAVASTDPVTGAQAIPPAELTHMERQGAVRMIPPRTIEGRPFYAGLAPLKSQAGATIGGALVLVDGVNVADGMRRFRLLLAAVTIGAIAAFVAGGALLARRFVRPLREAADVARAIAEGDLTTGTIPVTSEDEFGRLAESLNAMADQLREIVRGIMKVTGHVASQEQSRGVDQVTMAVNQMDKATQATAAQTEELSATAQSLAAQAEQLQDLVARFRLDGSGARAERSAAPPLDLIAEAPPRAARAKPRSPRPPVPVPAGAHGRNESAHANDDGFEKF